MLHARLRKGSSQRGHKRFVAELVPRVRRVGATGALTVRADSGFFAYGLIDTLGRLGVHWSITVPITKELRARIDAIDESAWRPITYPAGGEAHVAETTCAAGRSKHLDQVRLVVRRTRLTDPAQAQLWPDCATTPSSPTSTTIWSPLTSFTATTPPCSPPSAASAPYQCWPASQRGRRGRTENTHALTTSDKKSFSHRALSPPMPLHRRPPVTAAPQQLVQPTEIGGFS